MICFRCSGWPCSCPDGITIINGDCRAILPQLEPADLVLADPPYGMGKADWDVLIDPGEWLPAARRSPTVALFPGVRGLFDYPRPDWTMAWVRAASTQRNGRFRGFNNWEPILVYGGDRIANDVISLSNNYPAGDARDHPTPKPALVMKALLARLGGASVLDPFMGSGTTLVAAKQLNRRAIGIDIDEGFCALAARLLRQEVLVLN